MNQEIKSKAYIESLKGKSMREIAQELNLSQSTVHRAIQSVTKSHDYELAMKSISQFIEDYQRAGDYFKMQMRELEDLKSSLDKELDEGTDVTGKPITSKVKMMELRLKIIEMQSELNTKVLEHVRQGQVAKALQAIRDGKLRIANTISKEYNTSDGTTN